MDGYNIKKGCKIMIRINEVSTKKNYLKESRYDDKKSEVLRKIDLLDKDIEILNTMKSVEEIMDNDKNFEYFRGRSYADSINKRMSKDNISYTRSLHKEISSIEDMIDNCKDDLSNLDIKIKDIEDLRKRAKKYFSNNEEFKLISENSDKICFDVSGYYRINDFVIKIAKDLGLTSGMFTFKSSFTLHDAYTKNNAEIKIGYEDGCGVIKF